MNTIVVVSITIMVSLLCITNVDGTSETKPSYAQAFCGDAFIKAWQTVCKYKEQLGKNRSGRSLQPKKETTKNPSFLSKKEAKQFLHPLHRHRRQVAGQDDATEECCYERCTFGEIAEYKC